MRSRAIVAFMVLSLMVLACGSASATPTPVSTGAVGAFRVAILLPRTVSADSWTQKGHGGLLLIEKELGAGVAFTENVPEADFQQVFRQYAREGYDLVIGHGNQFTAAAEVVAAEFPRTAFAVDGKFGGNNVNLGALGMREGEMGYLMGTIAAIKSTTGRVAFLGGQENPSSRELQELFTRGAVATNPAIQVTTSWVGNFTDTARAAELAGVQIQSGVDVILVLAGAAGTGVHAQAEQAGIFTLAWIDDLSQLAPKAVVTSNVQDIPGMLLQGARIAKEGRWEGKQYRFGMAEGAQGLAPFNGLLSPEQIVRVEKVRDDILAGRADTTP